MIIDSLVHFLMQSYLNPALFLVYLSFQQIFKTLGIETFTSSGINNQRLIMSKYLLLMPGIYLIWFVINLFFLQSFNDDLSINSFVSLDIHWLRYISFLLTAITLKTYASKSGMEGNVMGFIFAPLLFTGIAINSIFHFMWVWDVVLKGGAA